MVVLHSLCLSRDAHVSNSLVLCCDLVVKLLVVESAQGWSDIVLLSHLEVFTEVLVSAPPVSVDHTETLASSDLMEVRVADVVLDSVDWESAVAMSSTVRLVGLTDSVSPMVDHLFLLILDHHPDDEGLVKVEDQKAVHESNTVLGMEWVNLPVGISDWVLEEASDVFERSPSLGIVTRLFSVVDKFSKVAVSILGQGSSDHISALIDVRHAVHEALDTSKALTHDRFGIVSVVEVLCHLLNDFYII